MKNIIIPLHGRRIDLIRNIRDTTNCGLKEAKEAAEAIEKIVSNLTPTINTARSHINKIMDEHAENTPENLQFMLDVLQFMQTTSPNNLRAHDILVGAFKENGDYSPF